MGRSNIFKLDVDANEQSIFGLKPMKLEKLVKLITTSVTITELVSFGKMVETFAKQAGNYFENLWGHSWVYCCLSFFRNQFETFYLRRNPAFWKGLNQRYEKLIEAAIILVVALMPVLNAWEVLLILTLLFYIIRFPGNKQPDTGLFIFWFALAVSALMVLGIQGISRLVQVTGWLLIAGLVGRGFSAKFSRKVISFMLIVSLLWMIIGLWQQVEGVATPSGWLEQGQSLLISVRSYSVFGNPNIYGLYLLSVLIFALLGIDSGDHRYRVVSWIILALGLISLFFTYSRTAWVLGLAALISWFGKRIFSGRRLYLWFGVLFLFSLPEFRIRMLGLTNFLESTFWFRVRTWQNTLKILADFWKWGSGPGSFAEVYRNYPTGSGLVQHGHQLYLQLWLESGILSLVAFIRVIFQNSAGFFRLQSTAKAVAMVIVVFLMDGFLETWWVHQFSGGYFWLLIGLLQSLRVGQIDL